jgi:formylmethanofuran dehydrogenase subunit A
MDRSYRDAQLSRINAKLLAGSALSDGLDREYTLEEIAIVTRAAPARLLGLTAKGHLGVGADADVTVYNRQDDVVQMFATPRYVVKAGALVVEEGQLRRAPQGQRLYVRPEFDRAVEARVRRHFEQYSTVSFDHYPVGTLPGAPRAVAG